MNRPPYFFRVAGWTHMSDANNDRTIDARDNVIVWKVQGEQYIYLKSSLFKTLFNIILSNMTSAEKEMHRVMINSPDYEQLGLFAIKYNRNAVVLQNKRTPIFSQRLQDTITRAISLMFMAKQQVGFRPVIGGNEKIISYEGIIWKHSRPTKSANSR